MSREGVELGFEFLDMSLLALAKSSLSTNVLDEQRKLAAVTLRCAILSLSPRLLRRQWLLLLAVAAAPIQHIFISIACTVWSSLHQIDRSDGGFRVSMIGIGGRVWLLHAVGMLSGLLRQEAIRCEMVGRVVAWKAVRSGVDILECD